MVYICSLKYAQFVQYQGESWSRGGPTLPENEYCTDCIKDEAKTKISANSYRDKILFMKYVVEVVLTGCYLDGNWYYVSRTW